MSTEDIYRIAVTGGPSAGKSTLMHTLEKYSPDTGRGAEVATILLSGGFPAPEHGEDRIWQDNFQVVIAAGQIALENIVIDRARQKGQNTVVFDRGLLDGAAYLAGGVPELERITGINEQAMLGRYDAVLHLASSALHGNYDKLSNPHRFEEADQALELERNTFNAWRNHPNRFVLDDEYKKHRVGRAMTLISRLSRER